MVEARWVTVQYSGSIPKGAKVRLLIGSDKDSVDITPHYLPSHLKVVLDVLFESDYWSKTGTRYVDCQVAAYFDSEMIPGGRWETRGWPSTAQLPRQSRGARTDSSLAHSQTALHHFIESVPLVRSLFVILRRREHDSVLR
jgi:hypothetical protein